MTALLEVRDLRTHFMTDDGEFPAVDGIGFSVSAGHTLAIVGESGCGKSVTSLSIMGLVPNPPGRIRGGSIVFEGRELVGASKRDMQDLRGNGMAMIFQEPMSSLNPVFTVGYQIGEVLRRHMGMTAKQARARSLAISSMICFWMVTSSAVVGSSAISSLGSQAMAMAIMTRCC